MTNYRTFIKDTERYTNDLKSQVNIINKAYLRYQKKKKIDIDEILQIISNAQSLCTQLNSELDSYNAYFNKVKSGLY